MDKFQVFYIAVKDQPVVCRKYDLESAMVIAAEQKTIRSIVPSREHGGLVFVTCKDEVGTAVAVDIGADHGVHRCDLSHQGERMKGKMTMAIVLEPAAARFFAL